jgi:hypothetical protein
MMTDEQRRDLWDAIEADERRMEEQAMDEDFFPKSEEPEQ